MDVGVGLDGYGEVAHLAEGVYVVDALLANMFLLAVAM